MKNSREMICCALWLFWSGLASGYSPSTTTAPPDSERSKSENGFQAVLMLSDRPDEVLQAWSGSRPIVPVETAESVPRGVPIVAFVFFTGCRADENGMCNASADFTILRPDGSVYESFGDRDLWKGKPAPPDGTLRLSAEYVGAVIEPDDPLGAYEVLVSVHDLNAGTTLDLRQVFLATEVSRSSIEP